MKKITHRRFKGKIESVYKPSGRFYFSNVVFSAGKVTNSPHPENVVYFDVSNVKTKKSITRSELTLFEALLLARLLIQACEGEVHNNERQTK